MFLELHQHFSLRITPAPGQVRQVVGLTKLFNKTLRLLHTTYQSIKTSQIRLCNNRSLRPSMNVYDNYKN